jgi:hypothetical protein
MMTMVLANRPDHCDFGIAQPIQIDPKHQSSQQLNNERTFERRFVRAMHRNPHDHLF